jgi:hypothetical protein
MRLAVRANVGKRLKAIRGVEALRATLATALGLNLAACGGQTNNTQGDAASTAGSEAGRTGVSATSPTGRLGADATTPTGPVSQDAASTTSPARPVTGDASSTTSPIGADAADGHVPFACADPTPVLVAGRDTGYDKCRGGAIRRRAIIECPQQLSADASCRDLEDSSVGMCTSNAECDAGAYGSCVLNGYLCACNYGCVRDSDCASGEICVCGAPVGTCTSASCNAGTCAQGAECASYSLQFCPGCIEGFACQTAADECFGDSDCNGVSSAGTVSCAITTTSARVCTQGNGE